MTIRKRTKGQTIIYITLYRNYRLGNKNPIKNCCVTLVTIGNTNPIKNCCVTLVTIGNTNLIKNCCVTLVTIGNTNPIKNCCVTLVTIGNTNPIKNCCVTLVTNQMISHLWGKDRIVIMKTEHTRDHLWHRYSSTSRLKI
jgi:hypothetical protein